MLEGMSLDKKEMHMVISLGRENDNPILDIREYCVEFDDGEVRKLTTIVI